MLARITTRPKLDGKTLRLRTLNANLEAFQSPRTLDYPQVAITIALKPRSCDV